MSARLIQLRIILLFLVLALVVPQPPPVAASAIRCRSDPFVLLSDGTILDVSADIETLLINVRYVRYELHIPAGLTVVALVRTPNWPTTVEMFTVHADMPPDTYKTVTTVRTASTGVAVHANLLVNLTYRTRSGWDGQRITIRLEQ